MRKFGRQLVVISSLLIAFAAGACAHAPGMAQPIAADRNTGGGNGGGGGGGY